MVILRAPVERVRDRHVGPAAFDAEDLVVARHRPHGALEERHLAREQVIVAPRLCFPDAQGVPHGIAGDDDEGRRKRVGDLAEPLRAREHSARDVRVGRMDERELGEALHRCQREVDARGRAVELTPGGTDAAMVVGRGDEHHPARAASQAVGAGCIGRDDAVLIRDDDVGDAALPAVADAVAVGVDEQEAEGGQPTRQ